MAPSDHTKINKLGLKRRTKSNKSSIANRGKICSNLELIPCWKIGNPETFSNPLAFDSLGIIWFTWLSVAQETQEAILLQVSYFHSSVSYKTCKTCQQNRECAKWISSKKIEEELDAQLEFTQGLSRT
jgi:hypothetical protein